tara:strand:- start:7607 stop:7780 length:174 start_codon:yes stop_codon:yes gene_type:complete
MFFMKINYRIFFKNFKSVFDTLIKNNYIAEWIFTFLIYVFNKILKSLFKVCAKDNKK